MMEVSEIQEKDKGQTLNCENRTGANQTKQKKTRKKLARAGNGKQYGAFKIKVTTLNVKELLKREGLAYRRILLFWSPYFSPPQARGRSWLEEQKLPY
jgi:hypothetical protein